MNVGTLSLSSRPLNSTFATHLPTDLFTACQISEEGAHTQLASLLVSGRSRGSLRLISRTCNSVPQRAVRRHHLYSARKSSFNTVVRALYNKRYETDINKERESHHLQRVAQFSLSNIDSVTLIGPFFRIKLNSLIKQPQRPIFIYTYVCQM